MDRFRKFQRLDFKLRKAKLDLKFLQECKRSSVIPTFLNFKISNRQLQDSNAYFQCQNKLLSEEINIKQTKIRVVSNELAESSEHLSTLVSSIDLLHLRSICNYSNSFTLRLHGFSTCSFLDVSKDKFTL